MPVYCNVEDTAYFSARFTYQATRSLCVESYAAYLEQSVACLSSTVCHAYAFALAKAIIALLLRIALDGYGVVLVHSLMNILRFENDDFAITGVADIFIFILVIVWILLTLLETRTIRPRKPVKRYRDHYGRYS